MQRNVTLYGWHQALTNGYFWMPVFFLYFSERFDLGAVLTLEAIYYATVVALEVPSGYFSDMMGRRRTLIISALMLVVSYLLFFIGEHFTVFAIAEMALAAGIAFNSGTDTAFHYDALCAVDRADEYAAREAAVNRTAIFARAVAALGGGLLASLDLSFAYAASAISAVALLLVTLLFKEPAHDETEPRRGITTQLALCARRIREPVLGWLFAFAVLMTVINHVPYELYQPYLDLLAEQRLPQAGEQTPLVLGLVTAVTLVIAALAAGYSIRLRDKVGTRATLLAMTALQTVIMIAMGIILHEIVLVLILLRSVPAAMMNPPLRAAITPRLPRSLRATYLSVQSLVGRLAFAGVLLVFARMLPAGSVPDEESLSFISLACGFGGAAGFFLLVGVSVDLSKP